MGMIQRPAVAATATATAGASGPGSGAPTYPLNLTALAAQAASTPTNYYAFDDNGYLGFGNGTLIMKSGASSTTLLAFNPVTGFYLGSITGTPGFNPSFALGVLWSGAWWYNSATSTWTQLQVGGSLVTIDAPVSQQLVVDASNPTRIPVLFYTVASTVRRYGLITGSQAAGFTLTADSAAAPTGLAAYSSKGCLANGGYTWICYNSSGNGAIAFKQTASGGSWTVVPQSGSWGGGSAGFTNNATVDASGTLWAVGPLNTTGTAVQNTAMSCTTAGTMTAWTAALPNLGASGFASGSAVPWVVGPINPTTPLLVLATTYADSISGSATRALAALWRMSSSGVATKVWDAGLAAQGANIATSLLARPGVAGAYNFLAGYGPAPGNSWLFQPTYT